MRELVEFDHAVPGELEETAYDYAASLVAKAGVFALAFGSTDLYALCRPRRAMTLGNAIVCIGKCLSFCREGHDKPADSDGIAEGLRQLEERFGQIDTKVTLLLQQHTVRESCTVKQVAEMLGKKPYTVREWCRWGRVVAKKLPGGRGGEGEWRITHEELERYQNEGLRPPTPQALLR